MNVIAQRSYDITAFNCFIFLKNEIVNIQVCNVLVTLFVSFNIIAQSRSLILVLTSIFIN